MTSYPWNFQNFTSFYSSWEIWNSLSRLIYGHRNNFRFPFSYLLTLWLSLLHKTRVAMRFPGEISSSCIWVAIPVDWASLHWYACSVDGRSVGRTVTWLPKFFRMGRLTHFLRYAWGYPLARFLRASVAPYYFFPLFSCRPIFIYTVESGTSYSIAENGNLNK